MKILLFIKNIVKYCLIATLAMLYTSLALSLWLLNGIMAFLTSREHLGDVFIGVFLLWETEATKNRREEEKRQLKQKMGFLNRIFNLLLRAIRRW